MKDQTLTQAIAETVDILIAADESFSIYDITKYLRKQVNTDQVYISNSPTFNFKGKQTYLINHDDVKREFESLYFGGAFPDMQRDFSGGYFLYSTEKSSSVVDNQSGDTTLKNSIQQKINDYILRRLENDNPPTLKSIQSRMKRDYLKVDRIREVCDELGYKIMPRDGFKPSLSLVLKV